MSSAKFCPGYYRKTTQSRRRECSIQYPDVKGTRQKAFWEADGVHEATEEIEGGHERQPCWDVDDRENVVNEYGVSCRDYRTETKHRKQN